MGVRRGRIVIGLMSGTSADGVDAVACEVRGRGIAMRARDLAHVHRTYSRTMREAVLAAGSGAAHDAEWFCRLNWRVGHVFAEAAERAIEAAKLRRRDVNLIGSHGQTICH